MYTSLKVILTNPPKNSPVTVHLYSEFPQKGSQEKKSLAHQACAGQNPLAQLQNPLNLGYQMQLSLHAVLTSLSNSFMTFSSLVLTILMKQITK